MYLQRRDTQYVLPQIQIFKTKIIILLNIQFLDHLKYFHEQARFFLYTIWHPNNFVITLKDIFLQLTFL